ncbi:MAG TPA: hypothetical protein PLL26_07265 [Candidatus Dojkabacteria bacterium]|nr:hypothetical protein [Candidatus Dojkabacteria bacterium]
MNVGKRDSLPKELTFLIKTGKMPNKSGIIDEESQKIGIQELLAEESDTIDKLIQPLPTL